MSDILRLAHLIEKGHALIKRTARGVYFRWRNDRNKPAAACAIGKARYAQFLERGNDPIAVWKHTSLNRVQEEYYTLTPAQRAHLAALPLPGLRKQYRDFLHRAAEDRWVDLAAVVTRLSDGGYPPPRVARILRGIDAVE